MITLPIKEALALWDQYWYQTKKEWFKAEVLQDYSGEDNGPSLQAWVADKQTKSLGLLTKESKRNEWVKMCRNSPAEKIRIHIVKTPLSPYLKWEIEHYKMINIPLAGEKVLLVDKNDLKDLSLPDGDFMTFDQERVVKNSYNKNGKCYQMTFYDKKDNIIPFLKLRSVLLNRATKLENFSY